MEELLTAQEVADYLKMSKGTIDNWRYMKPPRGPKFIKMGGDGDIRYPKDELLNWLNSGTSEKEIKEEK